MKNKFSLLIFSLIVIFLLGSFEQVSACSLSFETPSFCEMVGSADVIFIGKAIGAKKQKVTKENGVKETWDVGEIYFEVQKGFVGVRKGIRVTVRSGDEDGYCGTWFKHNESYLIFGYGNLKKGFVDGARTELVSEAQEDLKSLENLPKVGTGSTIFGNITQNVKSSLFSDNLQPMSGLGLRIQQLGGKKQSFEIFTDSNGYYEITEVPAGKYKVLPNLSKAVEFQSAEVEVKDRGCVNKNFLIRNKTKISGRVLDVEGLPVNEILVELVPVDLSEKPTIFALKDDDLTDEEGNFSLDNVPPGRYTLSVNYTIAPDEDDPFPTTFYPNASDKTQAMIFNIEFGSKDVEIIEFRLPPRLVSQEIKGIIVWSDGTPVFDAHVGLRNAEDNLFASDMRTDEAGNFTLNGFPGRKYYISANNYSSDKDSNLVSYVSSDKFILDKDIKPFRLVLEKKTK